jgi:putative membrane protein (TIGR04086 family)
MSNYKKNILVLLIWLILTLIIITISSIFIYFKVINITDKSIYIFICGITIFVILGFLSGNMNQKKGLVNGMLFALFIVTILFLIFLLGFEDKFTFDLFIKYLVFILSAGLGGVIGVNFKPVVK